MIANSVNSRLIFSHCSLMSCHLLTKIVTLEPHVNRFPYLSSERTGCHRHSPSQQTGWKRAVQEKTHRPKPRVQEEYSRGERKREMEWEMILQMIGSSKVVERRGIWVPNCHMSGLALPGLLGTCEAPCFGFSYQLIFFFLQSAFIFTAYMILNVHPVELHSCYYNCSTWVLEHGHAVRLLFGFCTCLKLGMAS